MADARSDEYKRAMQRATQTILEPLAGLMLECGIGIGELQTAAKLSLVLAARNAERDGHRPNVSRIASVTGLTRAQVRQLLADADHQPPHDHGANRAERVLRGWWSDPDFLDETGLPLALPVRGAKKSFATLVKRHSGDPRVNTLLDELCRVKAVRQLPDKRVEAVSRTTATVRWSPEGLEVLGNRVRSHLETLIHNLKNPSRPLYDREIVNEELDPRYAALLVRDFTSQVDTIADSMVDNLTDTRVTLRPAERRKDAVRLGMGFYLFESNSRREAEAPEIPKPPPTRRTHRKNK